MKINRNFLIIGTVFAVSTLILAGCSHPSSLETIEEREAVNIKLKEKKTNSGISLSDTKITTTTEEKKGQPSMPGYKTIDDFKKIEASQAVFETTKGNITIDLARDKAPLTTANFLDLIDSGFYDGIIFHRVIPGFMAQVGDPFTKEAGREHEWGMGGPTYRIMDEFHPDLVHDTPGVLSMANSGPNTGGSQIFITYDATPHLDGKHAVFGKVSEGMDVLLNIEKGDKIIKATYK